MTSSRPDAPAHGRVPGSALLSLGILAFLSSCGGDGGSTPVDPDPPDPDGEVVASITVTPDTALFHAEGTTVEFTAVARDIQGNVLADVSLEWRSADTSVVTLDESGVATARGNGAAQVSSTADGVEGRSEAVVRAGPLHWESLHVGLIHTCGLTTHGTAFCWGDNVHGQIGNGARAAVQQTPVRVHSGMRYLSALGVGGGNTCALSFQDNAYCWGNSSFGEGGFGENVNAQTEVTAVSGGHRFGNVAVGGSHACGVTPDEEAYCWGLNRQGRLGDGTTTDHSIPVRVGSDLPFIMIAAGSTYPVQDHTCGLAGDGTAYCWGPNAEGKLGDGTEEDRHLPTEVSGDLRFTIVSAGAAHTCGLSVDELAYCWGSNSGGQLGDGSGENSFGPVAVAGGLRFRDISAGSGHTCGVTIDGRAYCWGWNEKGQLGNGTNQNGSLPVEVAGDLSWVQIEAGASYTCGVTAMGEGYCWGSNEVSQLGGPFSDRTRPAKLPDPGDIAGGSG